MIQSVSTAWHSSLHSVNRRDLCFYALALVLAAVLKLAWRDCTPTEPRFFLAPLLAALEILAGAVFTPGPAGYLSQRGPVLISKDCAGMNYFLILFCLLVFSHLKKTRGWVKPSAFVLFAAAAYLLTLAANISRVLCTLMLGRPGLYPAVLAGEAHLMLGALVYFVYLLAGNSLVGYLLRLALGHRAVEEASS